MPAYCAGEVTIAVHKWFLVGAAHHCWATDINLFNHFGRRGARSQSLGEWVEVHADQIDGIDAMLLGRIAVAFQFTPCQQSTMHSRVQRLEPAVHHLRETGQVVDGSNRQSGGFQGPSGAASGHQLNPSLGERGRKGNNVGLVTDGQKGPSDGNEVWGILHGSDLDQFRLLRPTTPDFPTKATNGPVVWRNRSAPAGTSAVMRPSFRRTTRSTSSSAS